MTKWLLVAALLAVMPAQAQMIVPDINNESANALYPGCKAFAQGQPVTDTRLAIAGNYCSGLLHGLASLSEYVITVPEWRSCMPAAGIPNSQVARVVVKYLEDHPQRTHEDFRNLAMEAFHKAWPCN